MRRVPRRKIQNEDRRISEVDLSQTEMTTTDDQDDPRQGQSIDHCIISEI